MKQKSVFLISKETSKQEPSKKLEKRKGGKKERQ